MATASKNKSKVFHRTGNDADAWDEIENTIQHLDMTPDELLQYLYKKF